MAVYRGQINLIELIKPISLIIQSVLIGPGTVLHSLSTSLSLSFLCEAHICKVIFYLLLSLFTIVLADRTVLWSQEGFLA